jgi:cyclohexyl-isocyanide hydratase
LNKELTMSITRRRLGKLALATALAGAAFDRGRSTAANANETELDHDMSGMPANWHGNEKIAFLAYPRFTAQDLVGPHYMLSSLMGSTTYIVGKTKAPIVSDMKLTIVPDVSFDDCPADLDIICVPGGSEGTLAAMADPATIAFLKDRGSRAKWVTSVCTGSLVLGAAGLLSGYKATSHWVARDILKEMGAEPVDARVVVDRNRITAAGVTAGLDFGLRLVGMLRDPHYAEAVQLLAEYDPEPPFDSGSPRKASLDNRDMCEKMFSGFLEKARTIVSASKANKQL